MFKRRVSVLTAGVRATTKPKAVTVQMLSFSVIAVIKLVQPPKLQDTRVKRAPMPKQVV